LSTREPEQLRDPNKMAVRFSHIKAYIFRKMELSHGAYERQGSQSDKRGITQSLFEDRKVGTSERYGSICDRANLPFMPINAQCGLNAFFRISGDCAG
jgi:hypothetical protein